MAQNSGVSRALLIGGGFSGMTAALELHRAGISVELVEIDPNWSSYGAGISLHGAAMRVFQRIGILDRFLEVGAVAEGFDVRSPATDDIIVTLPTPVVGEGIPGGGGVLRPVLAGLLRDAVRATGMALRIGQSATAIDNGPAGAAVTFSDGTTDRYDLVVGADGLNSATRASVFPGIGGPRYVGQGVWRAVIATPEGVERGAMWAGPKMKAGLNRVSADRSYIFLTQDRATRDYVRPETLRDTFVALLGEFPSPILTKIRDGLGTDSEIMYRPLDQFLMPRPWSRGRVVLIGDAVHATTPHLAAGACIGMEDAVVLAEEIATGASLSDALDAFEERRWERCRMVVETSGRLCEIEITGGDKQHHARLMRETMIALAQPI